MRNLQRQLFSWEWHIAHRIHGGPGTPIALELTGPDRVDPFFALGATLELGKSLCHGCVCMADAIYRSDRGVRGRRLSDWAGA